MATDFTNKYMQVFQTYDEFGEHSADYVKGEDHIAYLIQENEVIYWLYLEQVWRPLNVRTTTTGELEDGRTKVAVRLEYVEGSQKYTSVPNIPDPERITSMSNFLKDYPDIEEVNISGTVNLTDLSYAFANSNIKDFSLLDTSNVTEWDHFIYNLDDKTLEFNIKCDVPEFDFFGNPDLYNVKIKGITFTTPNLTNDDYVFIGEDSDIDYVKGIGVRVDAAECTVGTIYSDVYSEIGWYARRQKLTNVNTINCDNTIINIGRVSDVTHNGENLTLCLLERQSNLDSDYELDHKITTNAKNITFVKGDPIYDIPFGYGIKYNEDANITINTTITFGNFYFTTPIVDDSFYAKYNHPISIFQYKTTFEEVADINLTESTNTSLTYIDWGSIDFDLSNTSIELYNNVNIDTRYYSGNIKKLIIDNSNVDGINKENCPYLHDFYSNRFKVTEGYVSGIFKSYNIYDMSQSCISENKLLKNITLIDFTYVTIDNGDFLKNNNIKFDYVNSNKYITLYIGGNKLTELDTLINDNNINVNLDCKFFGDDSYSRRIKNVDEVIFNIGNSIEDSETNIYIIIDLLFEGNNNIINSKIIIASGSPNDEQIRDSVYINGDSELKVFHKSSHSYNDYNYIKYIYGNNLTISIDGYNTNIDEDWNLSPYKHIDISNVTTVTYNNEFHILYFINCDDETNINTITRLADNTDNSSKTIYMYRSQANVIGEENIAGAVAKNYEFAIIEN